jgi:hypothetical protein
MREAEAEHDDGEADGHERGQRLAEERGAQQRGGDGTEREEDGDLGRRRMRERPEPDEVEDAAAEADEKDGDPAQGRETRPVAEEPFARGEEREERDRGQHRRGAHRQGRIFPQVGAIEDGADGAAERARQDRELADPGTSAAARQRLLAERQADAEDGQEDARALRPGEALVPERGGDQHGEEREGREDQRRAPRRDELQPDVEERDQDSELENPQEHDRRDVAALEAQPLAARDQERQEAEKADPVAEERERRGSRLVDDQPRRHHRRTDLDPGRRRRERRKEPQRSRSQVSPTRSWPKLRCGSDATSANPAPS